MRRLLLAAAVAAAAFAPSAHAAPDSNVHACDLMVYLGDEVPFVVRTVYPLLPRPAQEEYQHAVYVACSL
ncbi:MAG TPA: hypothetical protein VFQ85_07245 [Mycobacteriales bacterium]|jgi:hypothetical protein|nr:hypothetical protein [Mycobacteriales bacterium]